MILFYNKQRVCQANNYIEFRVSLKQSYSYYHVNICDAVIKDKDFVSRKTSEKVWIFSKVRSILFSLTEGVIMALKKLLNKGTVYKRNDG